MPQMNRSIRHRGTLMNSYKFPSSFPYPICAQMRAARPPAPRGQRGFRRRRAPGSPPRRPGRGRDGVTPRTGPPVPPPRPAGSHPGRAGDAAWRCPSGVSAPDPSSPSTFCRFLCFSAFQRPALFRKPLGRSLVPASFGRWCHGVPP